MNDVTPNGAGSHIGQDALGNPIVFVTQPQPVQDNTLSLVPGVQIDYLGVDAIEESPALEKGLVFYIDDVEQGSESAGITMNCLPVDLCMEFVNLMPEDEEKKVAVSLSGQLLDIAEKPITELISEIEEDSE